MMLGYTITSKENSMQHAKLTIVLQIYYHRQKI